MTLLCNNCQLARFVFIIYILPFFLFQDSKSVSGGNSRSTKQDEGENTEIVKNAKGGRVKGGKSGKSAKGKGKLDSGDATRTLELLMSAKVCVHN